MKESVMPARTRRTAAKPAPEPEVVEDEELEFDPEPYLNKKLTPTMEDYVQWWRDNVGDPDEIDSDLLITLGARFYNIFQKSDFNISRREERRNERSATRTARAASNGDAEEEDGDEEDEAPAKPSRRAAAKPAGRRPAAKSTASKPAAAKGGRRPAKGAAAY
jgi:hypothetical protein